MSQCKSHELAHGDYEDEETAELQHGVADPADATLEINYVVVQAGRT